MEQAVISRWQSCLQALRPELQKRVPKAQFEGAWSWYECLKPVAYREGTLVLEVPGKVWLEQFNSVYWPLLLPFLRQGFGNELKVSYVFPAEKKTETTSPADKQQDIPPLAPHLNPDYTFKNFVKGVSNKAALNIAKAIAKKPDQSTFNPLFLYGPSGVGKTHLVSAIGHAVLELHPDKRVLFVAAHLFKTQYTDAVRNNTVNDFLHFYQSIDVLIVDDIQELSTPNTQRTFFHIFNHLQLNGRQIIITCDRPPVLFEGIEERMLSRFKWGIVMEMERPDVLLRRDILAAKMRRENLKFPPEILDYIAENVTSNVRDLQGVVNSIMAFSVADDCEIDLELTQRVVARVVNMSRKDITLNDILKTLCAHFKVRQRDIIEKTRKADVVMVRQLVMYMAQKYAKMGQTQIGQELGRRDHATVLHGIRQMEKRLAADRAFRIEVEALEGSLKSQRN